MSTQATNPLKKIKPTTTLLTTDLDESIGEVYLSHGTASTTIEKIFSNGFKPKLCRKKGLIVGYGLLGQGTYFSDSLKKVMNYIPKTNAKQSESTDDEKFTEIMLIVSKVTLGNPKKRRGMLHPGNLRQDDTRTLKD